MAIELVPAGDERCDLCRGNPERGRPRPGEGRTVGTMCQACFDDFSLDLDLGTKLDELRPPDDPSGN
jgi:hypothetical protein